MESEAKLSLNAKQLHILRDALWTVYSRTNDVVLKHQIGIIDVKIGTLLNTLE